MRPPPCGAWSCQDGMGLNKVENPPPVPSPFDLPGLLFQTVSEVGVLRVPPQATTCGQLAGVSTLAAFGPPSDESLSPAAANTIIPASAAATTACSMSRAAALPQSASSHPQEIEHTSQPSAVAARTAEAMSSAQYIRIAAGLPVATEKPAAAT